MRNLFKQNNLFVCKHDTHKHFSSKMSVYHIMEEKKCYPDGCVYFKWKCRILAKKKKCHRNFTTVGKNCFSCKYFYEEKIHQFPQIEENLKAGFFEEYESFRDWIFEIQNKSVFCEGKISTILPDFTLNNNAGKPELGQKGFLINFNEGFIDNKLFEDSFYLHVNSLLQNKLRFREEDEVEFNAVVKQVEGRIELYSPRKVNFYLRGNSKPLLRSDLLVSLNTATTFNEQPTKCKKCAFSVIPKIQNNRHGRNRMLICSKGIKEPELCIEHIERSDLYFEECENAESNNTYCSKIL